jgi:hypothetical protein
MKQINDPMTDELDNSEQSFNFIPYVAAGLIALAIVLAAIFWPKFSAQSTVSQPNPSPPRIVPNTQPEKPAELQPEAQQVVVEPIDEVTLPAESTPEPVIPAPQPPEVDVSDIAVKTAVLVLAKNPEAARLLVDDDLLRRFVVFTNNLSDEELAPNFHLLNAPEKSFRTYQQAGKEWIDAASFKRYTPYAEAFDAMPVERLMRLYNLYKPSILGHYAEIGYPDKNFDITFSDAIDHLLDTPEIPIPVEVFTESVMYKYADTRIENLSAAQKQLLRTGPENMRLIKAKLREIKDAVEQLIP